ncbi:MAG: hypothetical protein Q7K43_04880, partial [Candidatus Woesearchaeota archaeon]|nr:hypothetical protein [Candidatus Woesearchaeota archaeon]
KQITGVDITAKECSPQCGEGGTTFTYFVVAPAGNTVLKSKWVDLTAKLRVSAGNTANTVRGSLPANSASGVSGPAATTGGALTAQ